MNILSIIFSLILIITISGCGQSAFEKGELYFKNGEYTKAIESFKSCNKSNKDEKKLYYIALSYHKLGNFEQAINYYDKLNNLKKKSSGLKKIMPTILKMRDKALIAQGMLYGKKNKLQKTYDCFKKMTSDYPPDFYMGIVYRKNGDFIRSIDSFKNAFNISNRRDNNAFICEVHWEMAKTFKEKFNKTDKLIDYLHYVEELRMAFFLRHPDKSKWRELATDYSLMKSDPVFIKNYGAFNDAYNRIGRGFSTGNTTEIAENASYLIENSPLETDIIYGYTSLCKLYLDILDKPYKALEYYKKAKTYLEGKKDSIPLRMVTGFGARIRKKIEEEKKNNE